MPDPQPPTYPKTPTHAPGRAPLRFEGFELLPGERRLVVRGETAKLGARAFDLLLMLVQERHRVVSKDELLERIWPGLVVEENNLAVHVSQLRKYCGQAAISTVPGRGYQFTAATPAAAPGMSDATDVPAAPPPRVRDAEPEMSLLPPAGDQGNLPPDIPPLIGRETELRELLHMLQTQRWVTITGPGGMGKTRMAEATGQVFAGQMPVWFIELAAVHDPSFVPNAVAQALGVSIVDAEQPLAAIIDALKGRAVLLILDNCEQVLPPVAALCRALLPRLPQLRLLVTSQEHMHTAEESVYKLGPLALPDAAALAAGPPEAVLATGALRLLRTRVQGLSRHFEFSTAAQLADAVEICRQLDGMPLAIELAAGRVPMLGLAGVRARLDERFRLLTGDARVRLRRHQTLRAALDWSYQLLSPAEQALLRRVGVFAGSFSIEGVRRIAEDLEGGEWAALDTLASLIDKSLVQVKGQDHPRYLLLESARAYALEQLAAHGETHDALARHAQATYALCRKATRERDTLAVWEEVANIRAAFGWALRNGQAELSVGLINESSAVLALGGLVGEVVQRLVDAEPCVTPELPKPLSALYWQWFGRFGTDGRLPVYRCIAALGKAEALFGELGNYRHGHACLRMRAEALLQQGDLDAAGSAVAAAQALELKHGSPEADRMRRLRVEGLILDARGECAQAIERLEQALDMARHAEIARYVITLLQDIGQALLHAGDIASAEARFRTVLEDPQRNITSAVAEAYARMGLLGALLAQGQTSPARAAAREAVSPLHSCGLLLTHAEVFAWLLAALGQAHGAATLLRTADAFRLFSQTARRPLQARAFEAARALLGSRADQLAGPPLTTEAAMAQMLSAALG